MIRVIRGRDLNFVPASHESPTDPGVFKKVLARRQDFMPGSLQMINWASMPVGKAFSAHYHEDMQEVFIILSGRAKIWISNEEVEIEAGDAVFIPCAAVHRMQNIGDCPVEYIALGVSGDKNGKTVTVAV